MLPRADLNAPRPVVLVEASLPAPTVGQAKQEAVERLLQLDLGKEYQGKVLSQLADGKFLVRIGNNDSAAAAAMALPQGTKTGDALDLTLLATTPRVTFLLGKESAPTAISDTGRLIGNLQQFAQQQGTANTPVIARMPLVASPNTPAPQIAQAMQQAIQSSGLFYESHVAQWAVGARPLSDLQREPAAKRVTTSLPGMSSDDGTASDDAGNELTRLVQGMRQLVSGERPAETTRTASAAHTSMQETITALTGKGQSPIEAIHAESAKLLNQQLDALDQRRILWQGELFPGQHMEWEIRDETPHQPREQAEQQQVWTSSVRFNLPTLGTMAATIRLSGEHVQMHITTPDDDTAALLLSHGGELSDSLQAAGTALDALLVRKKD